MENNKRVRNLGVLAFAPLFLFALWIFYYFVLLKDIIVQNRMGEHMEMAGITVNNYTPLLIMLAINFIVAFAAFLFFVWDVWVKQPIHVGNKIIWVIFMATFNLVAFPVYWYMHVKHQDFVRNNASPLLS